MRSPADARAHGIETVYQDLALFDNLGRGRQLLRRSRAGRPSLAAARTALPAHAGRWTDATREVLERFQVHLPDEESHRSASCPAASARPWRWPGRPRSAPAWSILDEPTAALGVRESRRVLDLVVRLRDAGHAVIVISHAMDHVSRGRRPRGRHAPGPGGGRGRLRARRTRPASSP